MHPYRQDDPETAAEDYRKLRELMAKYAARSSKPLPPIVSGEWGYSSGWKKFDEARQGKMLPREWLTNLSEGVALAIWYDWHDDGPVQTEPEHHFGTVRYEYRAQQREVYDPKPAYLAARTLSQTLGGFHFARRINVGAADAYVLRFEKDSDIRLVAWTRSNEPKEVTVPPADAPPGRYTATRHTGEASPAMEAGAAGLKLELTDAPVYLAAPARR
jgi:hypothetical protein